jgi:DNA-directed RNA polymerase specialized sigma subunit
MPTQRQRRATEADLESLRGMYLAQLDVLEVAATRVHEALDAAGAVLLIVRERIEQRAKVSDLAGHVEPVNLRAELATSLDELERARHRSQQLLFRILFAEGKSMADIGRAWGISRQLVSRLINEPL